MKVKGIPFNQVKESLLNTPEAIRGYQEADKELALVEMLYEMREKAGLSKSARRNGWGSRHLLLVASRGTPWGPA